MNEEKLCAEVEVQSGAKPYWFKLDEKGELAGGVANFCNLRYCRYYYILGRNYRLSY